MPEGLSDGAFLAAVQSAGTPRYPSAPPRPSPGLDTGVKNASKDADRQSAGQVNTGGCEPSPAPVILWEKGILSCEEKAGERVSYKREDTTSQAPRS